MSLRHLIVNDVAPTPPPGSSGPPGRRERRRPVDLAGWVAAGLLTSAYLVIGVLRIRNGWAGGLDLGLFDQGAWLLGQGSAPELTVIDDNLFGDHVSVVMVLFAPLYRLAPTPVWLVAGQALALGATVLPMRRLARDLGRPPMVATALVIASAPLLAASAFDFHPVVLTVPFTTWAIGAARKGDTRATTFAAVAVALIRADAAVLLLGVAVLAAPNARRRLLLLAPLPLLVGALVPTLLHSEQSFARYWGGLGSSPGDALTHPWRVVPVLLSSGTVATLLLWLLPVGVLTLVRPRWALALGIAGAPLLLSDNIAMWTPWFHHSATVVPFAIGGALAALSEQPERRRLQFVSLGVGACAALFVASPLAPDAPGSVRLTAIVTDNRPAGLDDALDRVGPDDAVTADRLLLPHLTQRKVAYQFPCPLREVDDVVCAAPDRRPLADVAVTDARHADTLRSLGWRVEVMPGNEIIVARRP